MNFKMYAENFNVVSEVGFPQNHEFVIAIFGDDQNGYSWQPAGYDVKNKNFYANMGLGGMVLDEKNCVAWISWDEFKLTKIGVIKDEA